MARPANKGKKCIRRKRASNGQMRCAQFGSAGSSGGGKRKGPCKKWSKGRTKCLKRG